MPNSQDNEQIRALSQHVLLKAVSALGGIEKLAEHLEVPQETLCDWIAGKSVPPVDAVLKAFSPLVTTSDPASFWRGMPRADK